MMPEIGFHCVIERPDSVNRVAPPTTTIRNTSPARIQSQAATARRLSARVRTAGAATGIGS